MKKYVEFTISSPLENKEMVMARISQLPIDSIWEDEELKFYIDEDILDDDLLNVIDALAEEMNVSYSKQALENRNWNAEWESDFNAVEVDDFVRIRALFHESIKGFEHELVVHPKMAFGTGHHATTWMMVKTMRGFVFRDANVLDYGTGTGILAILAKKLGSSSVEANDIEDIAIENAIENETLNEISGIRFLVGDLTSVSSGPFDYILANINRNVLLDSMPEMVLRLSEQGTIILSGVLDQDEETMVQCVKENGLDVTHIERRGDWLCMICES